MLRYALLNAPHGTVITFDPALNGKSLTLDTSVRDNHITISTNLMILGPGADRLTISGGNATRIFRIAGGNVQMSGLTLANGLGKGSDGAAGSGGGGGGGGAAGLGGAIILDGGALALIAVELKDNRAVGGSGGPGGAGLSPGNGGAGGIAGVSTLRSHQDGRAAQGGTPARIAAGEGEFGGGGGGGGFAIEGGSGRGGAGGIGGFGGGSGGGGAFLDGEGNSGSPGGGGGGGAFGGAIFVSSGYLQLSDTKFVGNSSTGGTAGMGAANGVAKGGALFVCTAYSCGRGHDGAAVWFGETAFRGNSAPDAGNDQACQGRDDADVCGPLGASAPTHFSVVAPPFVMPGVPFTVIVAALDANNNPVFTYSGSVHLSSSDTKAVLPGDSTLPDGKLAVSVTLKTLGRHTITTNDLAAPIAGASNPITVAADEMSTPSDPDSPM